MRKRERSIKRSLAALTLPADQEELLTYCDAVWEQVEALRKYEAMGLPTTAPPPSTLLRWIRERRKVLCRRPAEVVGAKLGQGSEPPPEDGPGQELRHCQ